jgi:hypothetical protein
MPNIDFDQKPRGAADRGEYRQAAGAIEGQASSGKASSVGASAFVKEGFRMFSPPRRSSLAIFPDENSEPHAGATISVLAGLAKFY